MSMVTIQTNESCPDDQGNTEGFEI